MEDAEARLDAAHRELAAARARLDELAGAPAAFRAVLADPAWRPGESGAHRTVRLLELSDERAGLDAALPELDGALRTAEAALRALDAVERTLAHASGWATADLGERRGTFSAFRYTYMAEAEHSAAQADQHLAALRTELADYQWAPAASAHIAAGDATPLVNKWHDGLYVSLADAEHIEQARDNIAVWEHRVRRAQERLRHRAAAARERLAAVDAERRALLSDGYWTSQR